MSQLSYLMQVTEEQKEKVLREHNLTQKEFEESVEVLKTWIKQNENIPKEPVTDNQVKMALLNSKMSIERAKKAIEGYLTCKTLYFDFFQHMVPEEKFQKTVKLGKSIIMPKLLPNLSRLHIAKIQDTQAEAENGMDYYFTAMMIAELRMLNDFFLSSSILADLEAFGLKNLIKFTPTVNYKLVHLLTSLSLRIDTIHIINVPPFWDKANMLIKAILPTKVYEKIKVHYSLDELHEHIPKEYLPSDYGGTEKSLEELQEMWTREIELHADVFRQLINLRAKEVLKVPQFTMDVGMGTDGSFKKLEID
ncbi:alpha-tocopherol transfer protein-like isoform X2 [Coccinella septempunctata]|uniref:alpha-tocopherol transfer protein-like isoform X2 n=1 Tax=Coccinella septempunctata TaxID=41139 RepID=UPI001D06963B|nr:alpha-tocopherol transfer protein-like isoform X2 [Coccinella septempunctata]